MAEIISGRIFVYVSVLFQVDMFVYWSLVRNQLSMQIFFHMYIQGSSVYVVDPFLTGVVTRIST